MRGFVLAAVVAVTMPVAAADPAPLDEAQIPALIQSLADDDPQVRADAAIALEQFGIESKAAVPALVGLLSDEAPYQPEFGFGRRQICDASLVTLIAIGSESVDELVGALDAPSIDVRRRAVHALGRIGPKARPALPRLLRLAASSDELTWNLVQALPQIDLQGEESFQYLLGRLQDDEPMVRQATARALGSFDSHWKAAVPALLKSLKDDAPSVRGYAAAALGQLAREAEVVVRELTALLADEAGYNDCFVCGHFCGVCDYRLVAGEAALSLGRFGAAATSAGPALMQRVRAGDRFAASSLGDLGAAAEPFVGELMQLVKQADLESNQRLAILKAFCRLGRHAAVAAPSLRTLLNQPSPEGQPDGTFKIAIACALVSIDFKENPRAWKRILDELDRIDGQSLADSIVSGPHDELLFQTLGRLGPKAEAAVPRLERRLAGYNSARVQVAEALGGIGWPAAASVKAIIRHPFYSWDEERGIRALLDLGPDSLPFLIESLDRLDVSDLDDADDQDEADEDQDQEESAAQHKNDD